MINFNKERLLDWNKNYVKRENVVTFKNIEGEAGSTDKEKKIYRNEIINETKSNEVEVNSLIGSDFFKSWKGALNLLQITFENKNRFI